MSPLAKSIYDAYPLKKEPKHAEKMILRALSSLSKEHGSLIKAHQYLLERTVEFSVRTRASNPKLEFVKHPGTWFNKGCYDEAPESWGPLPKEAGSSVPKEAQAREIWAERIEQEFRMPFPQDWVKAWDGLPSSIKSEILQAL